LTTQSTLIDNAQYSFQNPVLKKGRDNRRIDHSCTAGCLMQLSEAFIGGWILKLRVSETKCIDLVDGNIRNFSSVTAKVKGFLRTIFNSGVTKRKN
jgi:hypothetical protein